MQRRVTTLNGPGVAKGRQETAAGARSRRHGIRRARRKFGTSSWRGKPLLTRALADIATLAALALALAVLVGFLTSLAPTRFVTGVDRYPLTLIFRNFYGVETNAGGAYRWAKPSAALTFPVAAPATYRLGLTLSDAPAAVPRPVTVYVNNVQVGTVTPEATPREYPFIVAVPRTAWARGAGRTLTVELIAPAYVPPYCLVRWRALAGSRAHRTVVHV